MADVMEERIHSIERTAGFAFVIASVVLATTMLVHPVFPDVNRTSAVLQVITSARGDAWMQVHAVMAAGFAVAAIAFCALAFLLHMKGSSGSASVVSTCAVLGGGIWVTFLCAELYAYRFFANLYGVDPGGATMLFSTIWFWKVGALVAGALLFFGAVAFSGVAGVKRDLFPLWLGWGGALVALVGALVYILDFLSSTATGAASQPMQWPAMRYGVGLPIELWMLGVGAIFLKRYFAGNSRVRVTHTRVMGEPISRRSSEVRGSTAPTAFSGVAKQPAAPDPARPVPPRIPHPALAPDPEPEQPGPPKRPPPPQIFPG
ncbi:MAG: hypothetical protein E6K77_09490 [Candidatus Eisenbacteria bacterium]|uniref:DUF4386 domain-containing protein n=1 Tax=Eiseniibacteriota bacterium TaxID=2212470 RepID=A0A538TDI0_UNCEI|nr:MAG: hypothetical protein E6K77_09490 [Candidatus Eisenbacteria bacterium]